MNMLGSGQEVEIKPREITIYNVTLLEIKEKEIIFIVKCSKGTYIRSLCEDIARSLGTVGYMKELRRTKVGQFDLSKAITISELEKNIQNQGYIQDHFISIEKFYEQKEKIILDEKRLSLFLNGVKLKEQKQDDIYLIYNAKKQFIGFGEVKKQELKREIIVEYSKKREEK